MSTRTAPLGATPEEMRRLRELAVAVHRTIPSGPLAAAEADALIVEYRRLPRLGALPSHVERAPERTGKRARGGRGRKGKSSNHRRRDTG